MSGNLSGFDAGKVEPNEGFSPLPAGEYPMVIIDSNVKPTKEGTGRVLEIQTQVMAGQYQNRQFKTWIVLFNKDGQKNVIGQGTLSSICRSVNVMTPQDTSELHSKPFLGIVSVKKDDNGNPQNKLTGAKPRHTGPTNPSLIEQAFEDDGTEAGVVIKSPF